MGLSLHYNGKFGNPNMLQQMIEEVEDIACIYKWEYTIRNTTFPESSFNTDVHDNKVYGISFTPPDCETVSICFLSNGRMSSSSLLQFYGNSTDKTSKLYLYMVSVKTQFAGWQTHLFIVGLLKYLSKKAIHYSVVLWLSFIISVSSFLFLAAENCGPLLHSHLFYFLILYLHF